MARVFGARSSRKCKAAATKVRAAQSPRREITVRFTHLELLAVAVALRKEATFHTMPPNPLKGSARYKARMRIARQYRELATHVMLSS